MLSRMLQPAYGLAIDLARALVRALAYAPAYTTCAGREWRPTSSDRLVPRGGDGVDGWRGSRGGIHCITV